MNKTKRIYQIDLFRFIAAISVVLYHYLFRGYAADNMTDINFGKVGEYFKYGYLGVDLFFIISGFVIILSIKHNSIIKFMISRFIRLYPTYWLCLIISFFTIIYFGSPRYTATFNEFIFNTTMFQSFFKVKNIDGVYWSLATELKFYLIIGLFLIINKLKKISLDYLIYFWLLITVLYKFFNSYNLMKVANFFLILHWSSYFIAGMLFYQIYNKGINLKKGILLFICLVISLYNALNKIDVMETKFNTQFSPYIVSLVIISFYVLMFLISTNKLNSINSPKLIKYGILTYPLYLIHQNLGFIIFNNFGTYINKYLLLTITLFLMIAISYIISKKTDPFIAKRLKIRLDKYSRKIISLKK